MKLSYLKWIMVGWCLLIFNQQECLGVIPDEVQVQQANESARAEPKTEPRVEINIDTNLSAVHTILDKVCREYSSIVFTRLAPSVFSLFSALALVVLLWKVCVDGLLRKKLDGGGIAKLFIIFSLLAFFIKNCETFFQYFYQPLKEGTLAVTVLVVSITNPGVGKVTEVSQLLTHVDEKFVRIEKHARTLVNQSYFNIAAIINGLFILIIYKLTACLFVFYIADLSFGLMAMTALGPLFLAAYFFEPTRRYAKSAINSAVCCCLTLIFAGLSVGITLRLTQTFAVDNTGALLHTNGTWELLCIGFLCLMFMRRAPQLAASITGAADSGTAGMTAAMMMTAASMAKTVGTMGYGKVAAAFKATEMISNAGGKK